jgi:hypothetical protein
MGGIIGGKLSRVKQASIWQIFIVKSYFPTSLSLYLIYFVSIIVILLNSCREHSMQETSNEVNSPPSIKIRKAFRQSNENSKNTSFLIPMLESTQSIINIITRTETIF